VCYYNLKPTTQGNSAGYGINANAVPARPSGYPSGSPASNPAQTSALDFRSTGTEAFAADQYWSSTEASATYAWWQTFAPGGQYSYYGKSSTRRVRAIRRVAV